MRNVFNSRQFNTTYIKIYYKKIKRSYVTHWMFVEGVFADDKVAYMAGENVHKMSDLMNF